MGMDNRILTLLVVGGDIFWETVRAIALAVVSY